METCWIELKMRGFFTRCKVAVSLQGNPYGSGGVYSVSNWDLNSRRLADRIVKKFTADQRTQILVSWKSKETMAFNLAWHIHKLCGGEVNPWRNEWRINEVMINLVQPPGIRGHKSVTKIHSKMIHVFHSLSNTHLLSTCYVLGAMLWPQIHPWNKWIQLYLVVFNPVKEANWVSKCPLCSHICFPCTPKFVVQFPDLIWAFSFHFSFQSCLWRVGEEKNPYRQNQNLF